MELSNHESSSSGSSSSGHDYEVFLNFRGPDTRTGFTDHLYHSLKDSGVNVFRDDEELRVGGEISTNLIEAINKSTISIPIFSEGYASSKWCLEELACIAERRKTDNHTVMPIFYKILPTDVRNQTGSFKDCFSLHECSFSKETVGKWKRALKLVGSLKGWEIAKSRQYEVEVIKEIVSRVLRQLKKSYMVVTDFVVGVENHVANIKSMMSVDLGGAKIIGIHGMGGIGKTTLAKIIYNQLSDDYEGCCFLANVRETSKLNDIGVISLQNKLISDILKSGKFTINSVDGGIAIIKERLSKKKVLVCLDDVSKRNQLKALVGDKSWFCPGSRIIVTTRNKELLNEVGVDSSYEVTGMDFNRSLQLFSKHAFRRDCPPLNYITYSEKVVKLTGGLPLALEVIGSLLHGMPKDSWGARLEKLEKVPHEEVKENLMISYEELDIRQKQIFLDVACFFVGFDKTMILYFWDSALYPKEGMEVLEHMSLLKIKEDNRIWMHDQLIDFGKSITYEKGNIKQENRRRLCENDEALSILKKAQKEEIVEAMFLASKDLYEFAFTGKLFSSVPNLMFLQVHASSYDDYDYNFGKKLRRGWRTWTNPTVLPQLRWLSWPDFDPRYLRIKLSACNLVFLDLSNSKVTHKWECWSLIKAAISLRVLNLSQCHKLRRTPDLSENVKLELLILYFCDNLLHIHKSIGQLKRLAFLDLRACVRLQELPEEMGHLDSLVELALDGSGVRALPDSVGNLKSLKVLRLNATAITKLPTAIGGAENLEEIYLERCDSFREIPSEIGRLSSLIRLKITGYDSKINQVPKLPESLIYLHLHFQSHNVDNEVPDLSNLVNLRELDLSLYQHKEAPSLWGIEKLSKLETFELTAYGITHLSAGNDLGSLLLLKKFYLRGCYELQILPRLPSSLLNVSISSCYRLQSLPRLPSSLLNVSISCCFALEARIDVSNLVHLLSFAVSGAKKIAEIRGLPSSLVRLDLDGCESLKTFGDISNLKMLSELRVSNCAVTEIQGLDCLDKLQTLYLRDLHLLERLPDLRRLSQLKQLELPRFPMLKALPSLPSSLKALLIESCNFSNTSIDISNLLRLYMLTVKNSAVREIQGLEGLENLHTLHLERLPALERLPDLGSLSQLNCLSLYNCPVLPGLLRIPPNLVTLNGSRVRRLCYEHANELIDVCGCSQATGPRSLYRGEDGSWRYIIDPISGKAANVDDASSNVDHASSYFSEGAKDFG